MARSTSNPSRIDKSGATIDGNTIITYLEEKIDQNKIIQKTLLILKIYNDKCYKKLTFIYIMFS
jgi:hypothetical protein